MELELKQFVGTGIIIYMGGIRIKKVAVCSWNRNHFINPKSGLTSKE